MVELLAGGRCEYCKSLEKYRSSIYETDYILPFSKGGKAELENLARSCRNCNSDKHYKTHALDPVSNQLVSLFHPRLQKWSDHFVWSADTLEMLGKTPTGRATIAALKLNRIETINLRRLTLSVGEHPPNKG